MKNYLYMLKQFNGKKIVFFGTGSASKKMTDYFPFKIDYYVDNDSAKWNDLFCGVPIYQPTVLMAEDKEHLAIIIVSQYFEDIAKQLLGMGFEENKTFWNGFSLYEALFSVEFGVMNSIKKAPVLYNPPVDAADKISVSVIIPTKNASNEFEALLKSLRDQKGITELEIIVVDSGSRDQTLVIALQYNCNILNIEPEEFSHSYARNIGADHALGEYLLFVTQDILPTHDLWLYELYTFFIYNGVAAVSCAEIPRNDCDLFYLFLLNSKGMPKIGSLNYILEKPLDNDYLSLRMNAQINNVTCLILKSIFRDYGFRYNYAEDLDLGLRLINDGHKLGLMGTTQVIHSHNRSPFYFLKRAIVETIHLKLILPTFFTPNIDEKELVEDLVFCTCIIVCFVNKVKDIDCAGMTIKQLHIILESILVDLNTQSCCLLDPNSIEDKSLGEFLVFVQGVYLNYFSSKKISSECKSRVTFDTVKLFKGILDYQAGLNGFLDENIKMNVLQSFYKAFAWICGSNIGFFYINKSPNDSKLYKYVDKLTKGI